MTNYPIPGDPFTTEADIRFFDADLWSAYSDCYKSEYGMRPISTPSPAAMQEYLDGYESRLPQLRAMWAREEAYYDALEAQMEEERAAYLLEIAQEKIDLEEEKASDIEWGFIALEGLAAIRGGVKIGMGV